jgi:hypothetical protein
VFVDGLGALQATHAARASGMTIRLAAVAARNTDDPPTCEAYQSLTVAARRLPVELRLRRVRLVLPSPLLLDSALPAARLSAAQPADGQTSENPAFSDLCSATMPVVVIHVIPRLGQSVSLGLETRVRQHARLFADVAQSRRWPDGLRRRRTRSRETRRSYALYDGPRICYSPAMAVLKCRLNAVRTGGFSARVQCSD